MAPFTYATVGDRARAKKLVQSFVARIPRLTLLAPDVVEARLGARLTFRCPQRETGKIAAFTVPVVSDCHAATACKLANDSSVPVLNDDFSELATAVEQNHEAAKEQALKALLAALPDPAAV